jgi:hypothetical protein
MSGSRTVFRHQNSVKDHLRDVESEGKKYGNFHPAEQPDVDTMDILPASKRCETGECHQTDESVDLYARALRPVLVDDSINDENKTIEKIDKRGERKTSEDESATGDTSGDGNGGDGRR